MVFVLDWRPVLESAVEPVGVVQQHDPIPNREPPLTNHHTVTVVEGRVQL